MYINEISFLGIGRFPSAWAFLGGFDFLSRNLIPTLWRATPFDSSTSLMGPCPVFAPFPADEEIRRKSGPELGAGSWPTFPYTFNWQVRLVSRGALSLHHPSRPNRAPRQSRGRMVVERCEWWDVFCVDQWCCKDINEERKENHSTLTKLCGNKATNNNWLNRQEITKVQYDIVLIR